MMTPILRTALHLKRAEHNLRLGLRMMLQTHQLVQAVQVERSRSEEASVDAKRVGRRVLKRVSR